MTNWPDALLFGLHDGLSPYGLLAWMVYITVNLLFRADPRASKAFSRVFILCYFSAGAFFLTGVYNYWLMMPVFSMSVKLFACVFSAWLVIAACLLWRSWQTQAFSAASRTDIYLPLPVVSPGCWKAVAAGVLLASVLSIVAFSWAPSYPVTLAQGYLAYPGKLATAVSLLLSYQFSKVIPLILSAILLESVINYPLIRRPFEQIASFVLILLSACSGAVGVAILFITCQHQ